MVKVLLALTALAAAGEGEVLVIGPGSRQEVVRTETVGEAEYVPVRVLSRLLGARQVWQAELRRLKLECEGGPVVLVAGSPFVVTGQRTIQTRHPVVIRSGELWVPLEVFREPLAGLGGLGLAWVGQERAVTRRDPELVLEAAVLEGWGDTLTIALTHRGNPDVSVERQDVAVVVRLAGTTVSGDVPQELGGGGPVRRVRVVQEIGGASVEAFVGESSETSLSRSPQRTELKIWRTSAPTRALSARDRETVTVVIDPGHGGRDPGATGRGGLREKWVTLKVARLLREELLKRLSAIRVVLTRKGDIMVPLKRRTEVGNKERADVFLSLHANFSYNREARGMETYFLSVAKTDEERAVAAMENAPLGMEASWEGGGAQGELEFILWDSAQQAWLGQSADLARHIQDTAARRGLGTRGVKQAGFYVLSGAYMPAVLVEVGFLSNRREEGLLKEDKHLRALAEALADGVVAFLRTRVIQQ